jgi:hypothetical protein
MKTSESLEKLLASCGPNVLSTGRRLLETQSATPRASFFPTHLSDFDRLSGGLERGTLVQITGKGSSGKFSVELALLAATEAGEAAALVDLGDHLDPQIAEDSGVDLASLLWLRPTKFSEALKSTEIVLSAGFRLVILDLGIKEIRGAQAPEAAWVRLAREAKIRNSLVCLIAAAPFESSAIHTTLETAPLEGRWTEKKSSWRLLEGLDLQLRVLKQRGTPEQKRARLSLPVKDKF